MPVRFKGDSEYHEHFKWLDSPKSATFSPTKQQASATAGLSSPQVSVSQGFMDEPAILRKKKPIPLVTTSTTKMFDEDIVVPDDYMLLGSQEKFTQNVPYKDYLTKNRTRVLGTTYVAPLKKPSDFEQMQSSPSKPLAKIDFDTGAPNRRDKEEVRVSGTSKPLNPSRTRVIAKEPTSPVTPPLLSNGSSAREAVNSKTFAVPRSSAPARAENIPQFAPPKKSRAEPSRSQAAELVQEARKSEPRVKIGEKQDQTIDNTYAMKYRAGMAPKRGGAKRKSEYSYKFDWKKPVESTPLLAAQEVVHNNNPQVGPYKVGPPKKSEYSKEFKAWEYKPVISQDDSAVRDVRKSIKASKLRKTRSELDLTPDRLPAAGSPSRIYHDNARLTQSLNPQKPFFPHRRTVSWTTEYKSNYQSFNKFNYDKGAWKGAPPPHIRQQMNYEPENPLDSSNWTAEVHELREKAEEYRKRSNGTHFSRAHVAQLLSDNSKLWDVVSVSSDLSALDLEQSQVVSSRSPKDKSSSSSEKKTQTRQRTQSAQPVLRSTTKQRVNESVQTGLVREPGARKRLAWSSDGGRSTSPSDSARSIRSSSSATLSTITNSDRPPPRQSPCKREQRTQAQQQDKSSQVSESTDEGRVQTPELAASPVVHRHHLDITTPNRRGMILSSPPHKHQQQGASPHATPPRISEARISKPSGRADNSLTVNIPKRAANSQMISPTYGKPTPDSHALLNEDIPEPIDMILETRYVQSPQPKGMMAAVPEGAGMTYKVPVRQDDPWKAVSRRKRDDDEFSEISNISAASFMSAVSSTSSLASEVLERATRRQKQFWGNQAKA